MSIFLKKEKMRMHYTAPSFFSQDDHVFLFSDPKDARIEIERNAPAAVIFIPGENALSSPRPWVSALSSASYLVVLGKDCIEVKNFMKALDRAVFSPVARKLSSAFHAKTGEEAEALMNAVKDYNYNRLVIFDREDNDK